MFQRRYPESLISPCAARVKHQQRPNDANLIGMNDLKKNDSSRLIGHLLATFDTNGTKAY